MLPRLWVSLAMLLPLALGVTSIAATEPATAAGLATGPAAAPLQPTTTPPPTASAATVRAPSGHPSASPRDLPGVENFAQVSPVLYRSAQPTRTGFKTLKKLGIKTIISLRTTHSDRDDLSGLGMYYKRISFKPWHPEDEDIIPFLKILEDPRYHPVLVHCKHGADRTGTMVAIYRAYYQRWSMKRALAELPRFGFHKIWSNLKRYLRNLDLATLRARVEATAPARLKRVP